jgi:hypothetical protein
MWIDVCCDKILYIFQKKKKDLGPLFPDFFSQVSHYQNALTNDKNRGKTFSPKCIHNMRFSEINTVS